MADKASKLVAARKKLKDHQEKKHVKSISCSGSENDIDIALRNEELAAQAKNQVDHTENSNSTAIDSTPTTYQNLQSHEYSHISTHGEENCINATEILVSEKQNLNAKIASLENLLQLSNNELTQTMLQLNVSNQNMQKLEAEAIESKKNSNVLQSEWIFAMEKVNKYEQQLKELLERNTELEEHLETTKMNLTARNTENQALLSQLSHCQRELEISNLHLQQLTSGHGVIQSDCASESNILDQMKSIQQTNAKLEQQIKALLTDKEQLSAHYQYYIQQLNEQMESLMAKSHQQVIENESLTNREVNLIDQISQMEIKIQALQNHISVLDQHENIAPASSISEQFYEESANQSDIDKEKKEQNLQFEKELENAKKILLENENTITELNETIEKMKSEQPDVSKLSAANESDRVAAQRATAQNMKLKDELQGFQDAFILMNNDKLELTEKLQAEKYLNRELTIKLSECEEALKDTKNKLKAKDQEMIRLQASCTQLQKEKLQTSQELDRLRQQNVGNLEDDKAQRIEKVDLNVTTLKQYDNIREEESMAQDLRSEAQQNDKSEKGNSIVSNFNMLPNEQAMLKLQQRFLKTMKQLAELSDEKQNLEHIVLQLQEETETICEYIALYQQQRGILKQREEERETQLKYLTSERERMQAQLEQLQTMITSEDRLTGPSNHIQQERVDKIVNLLSEIKQNHLIDPAYKPCSGLESFHPCPWCSGKLIDV